MGERVGSGNYYSRVARVEAKQICIGGQCHNHSQSVLVVPLEDTSIPVRIHSTGLVHNRTRSTSPLRVSALRTGYACH